MADWRSTFGLPAPSDMVAFPGTKDIRQHPFAYAQGPIFRWCWKIWHFRFTRAGRWLAGATIAVFFFFSLFFSLEIQTFVPLIYFSLLWLPALPALFFAPRARLCIRHAERAAAGQSVPVELEVENTGRRLLLDLHVAAWGLPVPLDADPEEGVALGALEPGERRRVRLSLRCHRRGVYTIPGWRLFSDFPFGLVCAYRIVKETSKLTVHPTFAPLAGLELPTGRRWQPGGILTAAQTGDSFEYAGNRPWREGDRLRDIDWRSTARHAGAEDGGLIVREWREEYFLRVGVILDTHLPPGGSRKERLARAETLERAVSVCAAVSDALAARDYVVDIFAAGPKLMHLSAGRGRAYREQILDELACVEGYPEEPLSVIAPRLAEDLEKLTTVICILMDWDAPRQAFVEELRAQGVGVRVALVAGEGAPPLASDPELRVIPPEAVLSGRVFL